eukprot:TRINITY_DN6584_c0_g1_i2.p1 TRINITY_DN6584_c0_g1~~TRINITY_DN6584_c0_g1_i2.p1  ORF type:complete len:427 (-),score=68.75 TRINITY_DN6584_c0_g1_i2:7-1287(-)
MSETKPCNGQVLFRCECSRSFPMDELYYCYNCQKLECRFCITEEIDSYYCPNCLDILASAEAQQNFNSCKKCFVCPHCDAALIYSVKSDENAPPPEGDQPQAEIYFLSCGFCRWNSLMTDTKSSTASGLAAVGDPVSDPAFDKAMEAVQAEAKEVAALRDLRARPHAHKRRLLFNNNKTEAGANAPRAPVTIQDIDDTLDAKAAALTLQAQKPATTPDYTLPSYITSGALGPSPFVSHPPRHRSLLTRRSKHCRSCDKLVVRPDLNPSKIEFKRLHIAILALPRVKLSSASFISSSNTYEVQFVLVNPIRSSMSLELRDAPETPAATATLASTIPATYIAGIADDDPDDDDEKKNAPPADDPTSIVARIGNKLLLRATLKPTTQGSSPVSEGAKHTLRFGIQVNVKYQSALGDQAPKYVLEFDIEI